jgi:hypothetical protein
MRLLFIALLLMAFAFVAAPVRAVLTAPDNILYGTITLNGQLITASSNMVSVEARRTPAGPPIASYRMGSTAAATNFYLLRLPMEELSSVTASNISLKGDLVYLVVKVGAIDGPTLNYTFPGRGVATRMDFGIAPADGDNDGLPDGWELARFGHTLTTPGTVNPNGYTALQNFTMGSDPAGTNGLFKLTITMSNTVKVVTFFASKAEGAGYSGYIRHYVLESSTNLASGVWRGVPAYTDIVGSNQTVQYLSPSTNLTFFRGQIWLESP